MKRIAATICGAILMVSTLHAQDGLALGLGYRGFLNNIFINENILGCPQHGFYLAADYTCEELIGPLDVTIGVDLSRLWYLYSRGYDGMPMNLATFDLQIPLRIRWCFPIGSDDFKGFIQAGAVFDLGLTLKDGPRASGDYRARVDLFKDSIYPYWAQYPDRASPRYNQCDCFLGGGIGVLINDMFRITASADWGAVNRLRGYGDFEGPINAQNISTENSHNVQLNIGFAYCFN